MKRKEKTGLIYDQNISDHIRLSYDISEHIRIYRDVSEYIKIRPVLWNEI